MPADVIAQTLDLLGYGPTVNLLHAAQDVVDERDRLKAMNPNPRLALAAQLLQGMLANPALTTTAPGIQFLAQEAIDLADFLTLQCQSPAPSRGKSSVVQGEII